MHFKKAVIATALLFLAACSSSSSEIVKGLPGDVMHNSYVNDVTISSVPDNVTGEFRSTLDMALRTGLQKCAKGTIPLRLEVAVTLYSPQNAFQTIMIGDSNKIKGTAKLVDPRANTVLGDYDINASQGGGGIIGALAMSGAEGQMSTAFASEICSKAFQPD